MTVSLTLDILLKPSEVGTADEAAFDPSANLKAVSLRCMLVAVPGSGCKR